jgi:hypothetical protein
MQQHPEIVVEKDVPFFMTNPIIVSWEEANFTGFDIVQQQLCLL